MNTAGSGIPVPVPGEAKAQELRPRLVTVHVCRPVLLSLPFVAMSIASSSLNLAGGLVTLDPSNIPEHVERSNYSSPTSSPSEFEFRFAEAALMIRQRRALSTRKGGEQEIQDLLRS
eukprot:3299084-Rhodomonas_salina.1